MVTVKEIIEMLNVVKKIKNDYWQAENEIRNYNRADTVDMSPDEMNRFRHIAASAYFVSKGYPETALLLLGHGKEIADIFTHINWADRKFDLENNEKGIKIGKQFRYYNSKEIFDYIFVTEIKPRRK